MGATELLASSNDVPRIHEEKEEKLALQRAIALVKMRAPGLAVCDQAEVQSPCISVCRMSDTSGLCMGCFRTRDEIAEWGSAGDVARRATWARINQRMAALQV